MKVETLVVDGPLAFRMARLDAAEKRRNGLQILGMEALAARLAGGFVRPAGSEDVEAAVASALGQGGFIVIDGVRGLPGMVRAAASTLTKLWRSGIELERDGRTAQAGDVAELDRRVRALLPRGVLAPPDLARAGLERLRFAPVLLGPVAFSATAYVEPVWRPLVEGLSRTLVAAGLDMVGTPARTASAATPAASAGARVFVCSDPACEALEAVRWVRSVLATGDVRPRDVAVTASDTGPYDERMAALVAESGLPVHFSHGIPALSTADGQTCAALADVIVGGLSQDRIRRLLARLRGGGGPLAAMPHLVW